MRIAIYTQHFLGVGHHVRATRLARALLARHEVVVFDGGRPFANSATVQTRYRRQLPALARNGLVLAPFGSTLPLATVLADRERILRKGIGQFRPDVLLIDSYPLSRRCLGNEIQTAIATARASNHRLKVICSLRDVPRRVPESVAPGDDEDGAPSEEILNAGFDAILVHGDWRVTALEEHVSWVPQLRIPVHYTGYIRQEQAAPVAAAHMGPGPLVVVSCGGGVNGVSLLRLVAAAWGERRRQLRDGAGTLVAFAGAFMEGAQFAGISALCAANGVALKPFSSDFPSWLAAADLSISRAGYNTAVAVLAARARALLLPAWDVADQAFRARRLAELGLASTTTERNLDATGFARVIDESLARARPVHGIRLDGAERTVSAVEQLGQPNAGLHSRRMAATA